MGQGFGYNLLETFVKVKWHPSLRPKHLREFFRGSVELESFDHPDHDFILSILRANPSLRDSRSYLTHFGTKNSRSPSVFQTSQPDPLLKSILNPVFRRSALVKLQGPFTDQQLDSITRGLVYLEKLGLANIIVVENDHVSRGEQHERMILIEDTMRVVSKLERHSTRARPFLGAVVRLGPKLGQTEKPENIPLPESHALPSDLVPVFSALRAREVPVISPFALDSFCRCVRIDANDVITGLVQGMVEVSSECPKDESDEEIDFTPLRLIIFNRQGGVPSYARSGLPHLLINLASEYNYIHRTFDPSWHNCNPSALSNLSLTRNCLSIMPPAASAIMLSHRSSSFLISNLITNKPAVSSSLPYALLQGNRKLNSDTPTLIRWGSNIRVFRSVHELDKPKLRSLLEQSFKKHLDEQMYYHRLDFFFDYAIVVGDYAGIAIVTRENYLGADVPVEYLDKFAVLPAHHGDGTVDFLWVALHDESYGLGHPFSANPNGGKGGIGEGQDLVWRSRIDNPINKWYFERSSGHLRRGLWILFWCNTEKDLRARRGSQNMSDMERWEKYKLDGWANALLQIPSSWKP